jgi:hypothetical protein
MMNPAALIDGRWLSLQPDVYRFFTMENLASAFARNLALAGQKARSPVDAMFLVALEVLALALSRLAGLEWVAALLKRNLLENRLQTIARGPALYPLP